LAEKQSSISVMKESEINLRNGTTLEVLLHLGKRLADASDDLHELQTDMKPHAVYSTIAMTAALASLNTARTGIAQSIGYAALREYREKPA
jgi:hypothetical protein